MPPATPTGFAETLGLEFESIEPGSSVCELTVSDAHHNSYGVVHGGVLFSMADSGMGAALFAALDADEQCATIELKASFLRPVESGVLRCETTVIRRGRSVAHLESDITMDGESVARASGSFAIRTA